MISWLVIFTAITLLVIGITLFIRNVNGVLHLSGQGVATTELYWTKAIKHTVIMYLAPALILAVPFLGGKNLALEDFFQAGVAFLGISYLKKIYWQ